MKKYFSVGEAAKAAHTTSETLRHYDRIGLVKPSKKMNGQITVTTRNRILSGCIRCVLYSSWIYLCRRLKRYWNLMSWKKLWNF